MSETKQEMAVTSLIDWLRYALANWAPDGSDKAAAARAELAAFDAADLSHLERGSGRAVGEPQTSR